MRSNHFVVESVYQTNYNDVTIEISERISLHGRLGEMAKNESCLLDKYI